MKKNTTLLSWLFSAPIFFAITSFLLMVLVTVICGLFLPESDTTYTIIGTLIFASTLLAAIITLRRLPGDKMDRASFINIYNGQSLIIIGAAILSIMIAMYITPIKFWLFAMLHTRPGAIIAIFFAILLVLISLYITGVALCNFWAKFWRGINMKIPAWKIILSIPFGFSLTWIPGYFLPNSASKKPTIGATKLWYKKLSNWTLSQPRNAAIMFTTLVTLSGFITGFSSVLLTFALAMIFAIWVIHINAKQFEKNINGTYANVAIIMNITLILYYVIVLFIVK